MPFETQETSRQLTKPAVDGDREIRALNFRLVKNTNGATASILTTGVCGRIDSVVWSLQPADLDSLCVDWLRMRGLLTPADQIQDKILDLLDLPIRPEAVIEEYFEHAMVFTACAWPDNPDLLVSAIAMTADEWDAIMYGTRNEWIRLCNLIEVGAEQEILDKVTDRVGQAIALEAKKGEARFYRYLAYKYPFIECVPWVYYGTESYDKKVQICTLNIPVPEVTPA
jgi:hypothetical protein